MTKWRGATTVGGEAFCRLINEFEWDEDMINYVGALDHITGMDWIGQQFNLPNHFVCDNHGSSINGFEVLGIVSRSLEP
ncbi:hypothetical protein H5410_002599 [Solanum commersonii]|uniref:Uncharacterized protein n=1 Tax=Solanum commersonii TaxID=4109 RepID=A0A9J6B2R3_SOLCO|nr:hypothetical protein H5410_002599 [Solanum commersonii]